MREFGTDKGREGVKNPGYLANVICPLVDPLFAGCGDTNFQLPLLAASCSELASIPYLGWLQVDGAPVLPCSLGGAENCRVTCKVCEPEAVLE